MQNWFSIIYVSARPHTREQIGVGLILTNGSQSLYRFSPAKLRTLRSQIKPEALSFLKLNLEGLGKEETSGDSVVFSKEKLDYLSRYSNNLLLFSEPETIEIEFSQNAFDQLFANLISGIPDGPIIPDAFPSPRKIVSQSLFPLIKKRVNIDQVLTAQEVPSLLIPSVKVSFIGRNNCPVAGETINFVQGVETISRSISHYVTLVKAFELQGEPSGKFFLIGDEPQSKVYPAQHEIWKHVMSSDLFQIVPINELDLIPDYLGKHNVVPFLKK